MEEDYTLEQGKKPNRANTKSCSSVSDTWGFRFKVLTWLHPCNFSLSLSSSTSTPYVHLSTADSHTTGISTSCSLKMQLGIIHRPSSNELSQCPHWGSDSDKHRKLEYCWTETKKEESVMIISQLPCFQNSTIWASLWSLAPKLGWTLPHMDYSCSRFYMKFLPGTRITLPTSSINRRLSRRESYS